MDASKNDPNARGSGVLRAAGAMGLATFCSRILGLVREQVFAYMFGAGNATDAFNVAFRIPNLLRDLFAEGAMSAALVPTFTRARLEEGEERAWRVAGLVFRVLGCFVAILAVFGVIFADQLVSVYAGSYKDVPGKFELTVQMTRLMFPFFPLVAVAAAFMGILNACGKFFLPAFSSALFNLTSILTGVGCAKAIQALDSPVDPIVGMAVGVVMGGAVQALCQLPALYRAGYRFPKRQTATREYPIWYRDPALKRMLWMMIPGTVGLAATQVNILVNTILATSQMPGAVSWLNYAFRLMQFPIGVFGVSLAAATLPTVSRLWVNRDVRGVHQTISQSLRHVFAINLPASAGLAFLGFPIIQLIFQYGRFSESDTQATALALSMYAIGLTAYSAVKVLVPAFYAMGNTRVPVIASGVTVGVTVVLNILMVQPFGYWGLALGTSIGATINFLFLLFFLRKLIREAGESWSFAPLVRSFVTNATVALAMGGLVAYTHSGLVSWIPGDQVWVRLLRVMLVVIEGAVALVVLARVFGLTEVTEALDLLVGKIRRKIQRRSQR